MTASSTRTASLAALMACALPVSYADAMDGRYKLTEDAQCAADNTAGILRIEDGILYGAESRCRMTNPLDVRAMDATLYDMICIGQGAGWEERAMMMRAASGGLILVWNGYAFEYDACPPPAVRPRPRATGTGTPIGGVGRAGPPPARQID